MRLSKFKVDPFFGFVTVVMVMGVLAVVAGVFFGPDKAEVFVGLGALSINGFLAILTFRYVELTKELVDANVKQQSLLFPKLTVQVDGVESHAGAPKRDYLGNRETLVIQAILTLSNSSPLTDDSVWFESAVSTASWLEYKAYNFAPKDQMSEGLIVKLAKGESKLMTLAVHFSCGPGKAVISENYEVTAVLRDTFGQDIPVRLTISDIKLI
jgi:hypothetical protein